MRQNVKKLRQHLWYEEFYWRVSACGLSLSTNDKRDQLVGTTATWAGWKECVCCVYKLKRNI